MTSEEEIVTMLKDLKDKVDLMQRDQASLRFDIVQHIYHLISKKWNDDETRRREKSW